MALTFNFGSLDNFYFCCYFSKSVDRNLLSFYGFNSFFFKNLRSYNISKSLFYLFKGSLLFIEVNIFSNDIYKLLSLNLNLMFIIFNNFIYAVSSSVLFLDYFLNFLNFFIFYFLFFINRVFFIL